MSDILGVVVNPKSEDEEEVEGEGIPSVQEVQDEINKNQLGSVASILDKISVVSEKPPYLKILLYGEPGCGKTVLAANAPNPVLLDAEHGSRSLINHESTRQVPVLPVTTWNDVEDFFWAAYDKDPFFDDKETFIIDTYTELQKRNLDDILRREAAADASGQRSAFRATLPQYGENGQVMRRLAVNFRDLEKNLIITAHAVEDKDETTGALVMRPAVSPKLSETLIGMMDIVGYMWLEQHEDADGTLIDKRFLQVHPTRNVKAKCRVGGLPRIIEEPTFEMLLEAATK